MESGHIGVDESGKGDFFGPLVVAACYVGPEHLAELDGVCDSKKLTDARATALAIQIKRVCPYELVVIGPAKYNELYGKFKNLNHLLAWAHARAIEEILNKVPDATRVISDEFAKGGSIVQKRLFEKGQKLEFVSQVRAEADIAVAAASVLARAEFLYRLKRLSEDIGVDLPKGASQVIGSGKRVVALKGPEALATVAKMHFKTVGQVLGSDRGA